MGRKVVKICKIGHACDEKMFISIRYFSQGGPNTINASKQNMKKADATGIPVPLTPQTDIFDSKLPSGQNQ